MVTRSGKKANYERLYYNGVMYLAKGEPLLAEKFLGEAATQLKEYILCLGDEERAAAREWLLELCAHIKEIGKYRTTAAAPSRAGALSNDGRASEGEGEGGFAFSEADIPSVSFADVVGLEAVKAKIYDMVIYPRRYKALYDRFHKKAGGGILLYGPPGNGKTMIAKAIAHETGSLFFPVTFSDLGSKWFGESEGRIRRLFEEARRAESAVIFFDEIDAIAAKRTDASAADRMVAELLCQLDGIQRGGGCLTVLAATNRCECLDPAILRPGRFDEKIYIPLPDERERAAMFERRLCGVPADITDYARLGAACEGFSGAEIEGVCERAKQGVIRRIIAGAPDSLRICEGDVLAAILHERAS